MPIQARTEFAAALNQIASEKGVDVEVVIDAIEQAALAAYRKDLSLRGEEVPEEMDAFTAKINSSSGEITIHRGEENVTPPGFARIAAQTAKQVIAQRLHEAEKGAILDEYDKKVGTMISGSIQRQEGNTYFVDLGRAEGILPPQEQIRDEYYAPNQRMKFLIKEIRETGRGPEVVVSRSDPALIKSLFAMEVPEIQSGAVEIKEIAREAGGRTKLAAVSNQDGVDPVGSLVGQKGVRVQAVINELGEEKIDIVPYSEDPARFIASALSPAKDVVVSLNEEERVAKVKVPTAMLSLAIGKGGQNVRLAAKLTGWKIDIEGLEDGASSPSPFGEVAKKEPTADNLPTTVKPEGLAEGGEKAGGEGEMKEVSDVSADDTSAQAADDQGKVSDDNAKTDVTDDTVVDDKKDEEESPSATPDAEAMGVEKATGDGEAKDVTSEKAVEKAEETEDEAKVEGSPSAEATGDRAEETKKSDK